MRPSQRIWALVSGLPEPKRRKRVMLMLQAYIDDSAKGSPDLFVLAGYVSTAERWAAFSDEWQRLLDYRSDHYRKLDYFKMNEMVSERDRERCAWFHKVIEKYALAAISYTISTKDLKRLVTRMFTDTKTRAELSNPWHYAVSAMLWGYASNRHNVPSLPQAEPIEFIFDEATEKWLLAQAWEQFKALNPKEAPLMGPMPVFRSDLEYLPLQAADMFAWWVRHWQRNRLMGAEIYQCQYSWPRESQMPWTHIATTKEHISRRLREIRNSMGGFYAASFPWQE